MASFRRVASRLAIGAVLALTLLPVDVAFRAAGMAHCLACGELGTLDLVHNILLFIPVGAVITWKLRRPILAVVLAATASLVIEALQIAFVPGRDASLTDIAMNTIGAASGAVVIRGLFSGRAQWPPATVVFTAVLLFVGSIVGTAFLMQPAPIPEGKILYGQWGPGRAGFAPWAGRVTSLQVGTVAAPHTFIPEQDQLKQEWRRRAPVQLTSTAAPPTGLSPVLMARIVAVDDELILLGEQGENLIVRIRLRASDVGLRTVMFAIRVPRERAGAPSIMASVRLTDENVLDVQVASGGSTVHERAGLDATLGWVLLLPVDVPLPAWARSVGSAFWVALLTVPLGFGLAGLWKGLPTLAIVVAGLVVVATLWVVPGVLGVAPTPGACWIASAVGVEVGRRLGGGRPFGVV